MHMQLTSPDFISGGNIPPKFTCDGGDASPELHIAGVPEGTKSLALVLYDPDAPNGTFTHWMVWNIGPETEKIESGTLPLGAIEGLNSVRTQAYIGPCPPEGTHNYIFTLYALNESVEDIDPKTTDNAALVRRIKGHIIAEAELVGLYSRGSSPVDHHSGE